MTENTIDSNTGQGGGGLFLFDSAATIRQNRIIGNSAVRSGGGIGLSANAAPILDSNIFASNQATVTEAGSRR